MNIFAGVSEFLGGLSNNAAGLLDSAIGIQERYNTLTGKNQGKTDQTGQPITVDPRTEKVAGTDGPGKWLLPAVAIGGGLLALIIVKGIK